MADPRERRRHTRVPVAHDIALRWGEEMVSCSIDNISTGGARIVGRLDLTKGTRVTLYLGDVGQVAGEIAWLGDTAAGVRFDRDVDDIADLLLAMATY